MWLSSQLDGWSRLSEGELSLGLLTLVTVWDPDLASPRGETPFPLWAMQSLVQMAFSFSLLCSLAQTLLDAAPRSLLPQGPAPLSTPCSGLGHSLSLVSPWAPCGHLHCGQVAVSRFLEAIANSTPVLFPGVQCTELRGHLSTTDGQVSRIPRRGGWC